MGLQVIGAGYGRTGTDSMRHALGILGFGPCYHMYEVLPDKERYQSWIDIANGATPDWDRQFAGFRATVDWPGACFWRELADHYPEAKILLTVRSSESWYASMEKTILKMLRANDMDNSRIGIALIARREFGGELHDRDTIISAYERNIAEVQASFGPDRLLTYELGSGWEPLCDFLERPVPDEPYPSGNAAEAFHSRGAEAVAKREG